MKKRIMVLMAVAALMVTMVAMSVSPAFAAWYETAAPGVLCRTGDSITIVGSYPPFLKLDRNGDGWVCQTETKQGDFRSYDNRRSF